MKVIDYVVTDPVGIHARPAGQLAKLAKEVTSKVTIEFGDKSAEAGRLLAVMGLGIKSGDKMTVKIEGADEEEAAVKLEEFLKNNL